MSNKTRIERIRESLLAAFEPETLDVRDDSHKHIGHAGARDGRGHFHVTIRAEAFRGKRPLQRHRMVFDALGSMMETDIHALQIDAAAPETNPNHPEDTSGQNH
jgi:BolA protein